MLIYSTPSLPVFRSICLLSSHLRLGLPSGFFPSAFLTSILYEYILPARHNYILRNNSGGPVYYLLMILTGGAREHSTKPFWPFAIEAGHVWFQIINLELSLVPRGSAVLAKYSVAY